MSQLYIHIHRVLCSATDFLIHIRNGREYIRLIQLWLQRCFLVKMIRHTLPYQVKRQLRYMDLRY